MAQCPLPTPVLLAVPGPSRALLGNGGCILGFLIIVVSILSQLTLDTLSQCRRGRGLRRGWFTNVDDWPPWHVFSHYPTALYLLTHQPG